MKPTNELARRRAQSENANSRQQQAALEMQAKTFQEGMIRLNNHLAVKIDDMVPGFYRQLAKLVRPIWWVKMWAWLGQAVLKIMNFFFIQPLQILYGILNRWGCYTQAKMIDEWVVKVVVYRWFRKRYACEWDLRYNKTKLEASWK